MPIKKVAAWALGLGALAAGAATMAQEREDRGGGGGGGRGGGGGLATVRIPQHMTAELNMLIGQKKTALEIRDFLSGEFEPLPLGDLMVYFRAQEKAGTIRLTPRPSDPAPAKKKLNSPWLEAHARAFHDP